MSPKHVSWLEHMMAIFSAHCLRWGVVVRSTNGSKHVSCSLVSTNGIIKWCEVGFVRITKSIGASKFVGVSRVVNRNKRAEIFHPSIDKTIEDTTIDIIVRFSNLKNEKKNPHFLRELGLTIIAAFVNYSSSIAFLRAVWHHRARTVRTRTSCGAVGHTRSEWMERPKQIPIFDSIVAKCIRTPIQSIMEEISLSHVISQKCAILSVRDSKHFRSSIDFISCHWCQASPVGYEFYFHSNTTQSMFLIMCVESLDDIITISRDRGEG